MNIRSQQGLSIIEVLIGLAVFGLVTVSLVEQTATAGDQVRNRAAAEQLTLVATAAARYEKDNNAILTASATTAVPVATTVATLVSGGYLNTGFQATNAFGQTACMLTLKNAAGRLQSLIVTEGGQPVPQKYRYVIASLAGARGGGIEGTTVNGAFGGWTLPLGNYTAANCSGTATGDNRLAALVTLDGTNSAAIADYLYRYSVPGFPDANRMFTNIDMNGNNINNGNDVVAKRFVDADNNTFLLDPGSISNLSTVNFVDGKVSTRSSTVNLSSYLGNYVHKGNFFQANNTTVPKPTCPDGGTTNIDVLPQRNLTIDGYQIPAPVDNGATWTVRILDSASTLVTGATFLARTYCQYS
ncbi:MAG: shufflon system plasmid conjugative transfer pilus tip adhesin PilV [Rhodocyclaceae bacterium]|nr:shufflon system plasmid conjugative transfer pilus tip adhesin PilV [Rhodocyclaceae bacterium]